MTHSPVDWLQEVWSARENEESFKNYLHVRQRVIGMLEEAQVRQNVPSSYWQEEIAGFDYLFDASPLIIRNLRRHCYHITGVLDYSYRGHHAYRRTAYARKLN